MTEEMKEIIEYEFKNGHKLLSLNHYSRNGEEVKLELEREWLDYVQDEVHLLSPRKFHVRDLVYLYVQELIEILPELKREGKIEKSLLNVIETLLLALDYLTHERFAYAPFTEEHRTELKLIVKDCFSEMKSTSFLVDTNRPSLTKSKIIEGEDKIYCLDEREERTRIYMAVVYTKPQSQMEHFKQIGQWLWKLDLKPDEGEVPYNEYLEGKTSHDLHESLLFYLSMVKRTFSWVLNSTSWRSNELMGFDEMDIRSKLGLK